MAGTRACPGLDPGPGMTQRKIHPKAASVLHQSLRAALLTRGQIAPLSESRRAVPGRRRDPAVQTMFFVVFAEHRFKDRQGAAMKLVEITPRQRTRLYAALVKKEADIGAEGRVTFFRVRPQPQTKVNGKTTKPT